MGENDRELLELAAKAAGLRLTWGEKYRVGDDEVDCTDMPYALSDSPDEAPAYWNPLEDDADALRLAVKLQLTVTSGVARVPSGDFTAIEYSDNGSRDELALTRRAIVRAAADLTKESP
jgi:hypothetical protein